MEAAPGESDKGRAGCADVSSMTSSGGERREKPRKTGFYIFFLDIRYVISRLLRWRWWQHELMLCSSIARRVFRLDELGQEILRIAVPAALALAADPLASLVDTAFIGRLGLPDPPFLVSLSLMIPLHLIRNINLQTLLIVCNCSKLRKPIVK